VFYDLNLLSITLNILAPTSDILSIITSCNCSYQHVNLLNEFDEKFNKLNKDCGIGCSMLNILLNCQY
jgi:hypothetical protein